MLRQLTKLNTAALRPSTLVAARTISTSAIRMGEGDTGGFRNTGGGSQDAFQKREKASEDWAIRQREKQKLLELKAKLAEQQAHLSALAEHIDELTKDDTPSK